MLIDNKVDRYPETGLGIRTVWDFISLYSGQQSGQTGKLDIVTGYFTIRALSKLYRELPAEDEFRIVSSEMIREEKQLEDIKDLLNGDFSVDTTLQLDQYAQEAKAFLERNSVQIRAIANAFCHAKAYLFKNNVATNNGYYLTGSSNLTDAGLGLKPTSNVELTIGDSVNKANSDYKEVCHWFEAIWKTAKEKIQDPANPKSGLISVKDYFIRMIEEYFRKYTPEEIYYKILYELFKADLDLDGSSIEHQQDMSLLQTSEIWRTLFNYQQKGVISLIKMLRKYNGAILADAVGLGKTFSALAVIKFFQIQGYTTVLLCPKKLQQNWTQYLKGAGSRFDKDRFDYQVRFHTDLQNERLQNSYDTYKLDYLQRREKLLIVIDESHNLRNEKSSRYQDLMDSIIRAQSQKEGHQLKVLMLSATPINTGLKDVKGQFNLIGRGDDNAFDTNDFGVESLRSLFADSQRKYTEWCADPQRTIGSFIAKLSPKFFNLTDRLIVARTRKLIEKTLGEDMGFPEKAKPRNIYKGVDHFGKYKNTDEIYKAFEQLTLTAYQPSLYIPDRPQQARKGAKNDWNDNVNRERFLVKMMSILFMKRLESSWYSCMLTVKKVLDVHEQTLQKVLDFEEHKKNGVVDIDVPDEDENFDTDDLFTLRKGTISLSEMKNLGGFKRGLQHNVKCLNEIYLSLKTFEQDYRNKFEQDEKLDVLAALLREKQQSKNKKIVIFTAYSDTAKFLYDELQLRGFSRIASVSGTAIYSSGHHRTNDFQDVLQSFAPYSKLYKEKDWSLLYEDAHLDTAQYFDAEKRQWRVPYSIWEQLVRAKEPSVTRLLDDPIDILIASDCLSEGQNLQDADMQVNYDIHWNPVRLIQRFGRIDRIGSPNQLIQCVNFWPASSFEEYLHLESRIMNRMVIMNLTGAETQQLNDEYMQMEKDNPLVDKNADRLLAELQNNSISDIESPQTLSLKDFSLEVYRQDLLDYFEKYKQQLERMPNGIFTGFKNEDTLFEHIPESLVAIVGYPKRESATDRYREIYLMCQPADKSQAPTFTEMNRAEILDFLRMNKRQDRHLPDWIDKPQNERIAKLQAIVQQWFDTQVPQQATNAILQIAQSRKGIKPAAKNDGVRLEDKFNREKFDLIAWEYVS
ncbi:MAG: DEAD/DEAH box helicase family protein [Prevotella sp.]|nr:DEAD/DEAH box helicase family protein [Prevotella sp.]